MKIISSITYVFSAKEMRQFFDIWAAGHCDYVEGGGLPGEIVTKLDMHFDNITAYYNNMDPSEIKHMLRQTEFAIIKE